MKTRTSKKWRESEWKGFSREMKVMLLKGLGILILFLLGVSILCGNFGCAFTHRGETSVGLFKDVDRSGEESSRLSIARPARD